MSAFSAPCLRDRASWLLPPKPDVCTPDAPKSRGQIFSGAAAPAQPLAPPILESKRERDEVDALNPTLPTPPPRGVRLS